MNEFQTFLYAVMDMTYRMIETFLGYAPFILLLCVGGTLATVFGIDLDMTVMDGLISIGGIIVLAIIAAVVGFIINHILPESWQTRISFGGSALIHAEKRRLIGNEEAPILVVPPKLEVPLID